MISETTIKVIFKYMDMRFKDFKIFDLGSEIHIKIDKDDSETFLYDKRTKNLFTDNWPENEIMEYFNVVRSPAQKLIGKWVSQKFNLEIKNVF